ncbi:MAG TPA: D-glycerate dehydrogenase [Myxococcota bacterium]|nr:D-glycerate dehydrogenase [Myxococcota bacterium]HQP95912.1 D-glycerate dehydrogenase [Myxococcota bacterium]
MKRDTRIFVSREIPQAGLDLLADIDNLTVWRDEMPPPRDEMLAAVRDCDGVILLLSDTVDDQLLAAAGPRLKVVSLFSAGFNNVDIAAATKRGVVVTNTPGQLTETTAELAFTLMMAAARRVKEGIENVESGRWKTWGPRTLLGQDLLGATLGIAGMGRIGAAVARRAIAFGMRVVYFDPSPFMVPPADAPVRQAASLEEMLSQSDFVSLHCPLTPKTRHMINRDTLRLMKPNAILVNTGRGPCVDTDALVEALGQGRIFAAGLDVTDPEPLPPDHPLVSMPNCLIVPHIGSASIATRDAMATGAAQNLIDVLEGRLPTDTLNPEALR